MFQWYGSLYKSAKDTAALTILIQLVLYIIIFVGTCYASSFLAVDESIVDEFKYFISEFEYYFTLIASILFVIPTGFTAMALYGLQNDEVHRTMFLLKGYVVPFGIFYSIYALCLLAAGLLSIFEGTLALGCTVVVLDILISAFTFHSIAMCYCAHLQIYDDIMVSDSIGCENSIVSDT